MQSVKEIYKKEAIPQMREKFGLANDLAVPQIEKIVVNTGVGQYKDDEKTREEITKDLSLITGQRPVKKLAKKAISSFKIREGSVVGLAVTLRGQRMCDFYDRLVNVALPRSRDFKGIDEKKIDQGGNFNIGIKEQIIFPEISAENARNIFGFEVCIKTTAQDREQSVELFKILKFPFKKK